MFTYTGDDTGDDSGAAAAIKCNIMLMGLVGWVATVITIK